jgi:hypothetical protein
MDIFVEELDNDFNDDLYERLLRENVLAVEYKKYLRLYIKRIKDVKGNGKYELRNGVPYFRNLYFLNFMLWLINLILMFIMKSLNNLITSSFESWLLHPDMFDYSEFRPEWVLVTDFDTFLSKFRKIPQ